MGWGVARCYVPLSEGSDTYDFTHHVLDGLEYSPGWDARVSFSYLADRMVHPIHAGGVFFSLPEHLRHLPCDVSSRPVGFGCDTPVAEAEEASSGYSIPSTVLIHGH